MVLKRLVLGLFFMPLLSICTSCDDSEKIVNTSIINVGDSLPDFSVTSNDGILYSSENLKGYTSVIVFFYTPCGDCKKALPVIDQLYKSYSDKDNIRWIAISRSESYNLVESYWENNGFTIPFSAQNDRSIYALFAYSGIPRIYIANSKGIITSVFDDSSHLTHAMLEQAIISTFE